MHDASKGVKRDVDRMPGVLDGGIEDTGGIDPSGGIDPGACARSNRSVTAGRRVAVGALARRELGPEAPSRGRRRACGASARPGWAGLLLDAHGGIGQGSELRRIVVIGRAGAGKTTVALAIGAMLGLPVVHLDPLAWAPDWRPVPAADFDARHATAIAADSWVLDGGYLSRAGWAERLARADVVVLVEAPLLVCLWRIMRRGIRGRVGRRGGAGRATGGLGGTGRPVAVARRPDLPAGCDDELGLGFVFWTVTWGWRTRTALRRLRRAEPGLPPLERIRTAWR